MPKPAMSLQRVGHAIAIVRGHKVMLDEDLAILYGAPTKALVQAVKRNRSRFPTDFMFQLDKTEAAISRSQNVTSRSWGGRRTRPYAFTEQGVEAVTIGTSMIYRELLKKIVEMFQTKQAPLDIAVTVEIVAFIEAALRSGHNHGAGESLSL